MGTQYLLHNDPRPQVKVLLDYLQELVFVPGRCTVVKHRDGQGVAHSNGIGDLGKPRGTMSIASVDLLWDEQTRYQGHGGRNKLNA